MTDLYTRRQYEEAASDDDAAAVRAEVEAGILDVHTSAPGIVESFNASTQTAVVRPAIQKYFRGQGFRPLPALFDVPVVFPRGGGFVLTFPIAAGDECLLCFAERAIDAWWESGKNSPPPDLRTHDLSDAFALVGVASRPKVIASFNAAAVELRSADGQAKVQIDPQHNITVETAGGMIRLNAPPGATQMINGVLTAADPCPILGATHGSFGGGCARVLAGKT